MKTPACLLNKIVPGLVQRTVRPSVLAAILLPFGVHQAFAQTTNALDAASDPAYANQGPPNGLSPGGQNGGYGFGPWTFMVNGNGGAFVNGTGPSGASFDLWNMDGNSTTVAVRPFSSPLAVGQSFSVQLRLNNLDGTSNTNALQLEDASGNILFSYFHLGGDNLNGHYSDANTSDSPAVNFYYDYQQFDSFTFTLNSATTYTFTDNTTGASVSGFISGGPIAQVAFYRGNGNPTGNGQDFQFDELMITSSGQVAPPGFQQPFPTPGSFSVTTTNAISVEIVPGGAAVSANNVSLAVDGSLVTPSITTGAGGALNINYQPPAPLTPGTTHTAKVVVEDASNNFFTNSWSFTTAFVSLPAVLPGPFSVSNNNDIVIFDAKDNWLGTNYGPNSSLTLYARFDMTFGSLNDGGTTYGGLEFYQDNTEQLLAGKNGLSANWSVGAGAPNNDIPPGVGINPGEWHTIVERIDYQPGGNANVSVWLDPDWTQTEANQPNGPLTFSVNNTFNNVHLRCGFGAASAEYSNIVMAATSAGVGFAPPAEPQFQSFVPGINAPSAPPATPLSVKTIFGTYGISSNTITLNLDGTNVTPTFAIATNAITINYQPLTPFAPGSTHSVTVSLADSNGTPYSTSWSFTVDAYPVLPVSQAGPFDVSSGADTILWTAQNGWIGNHYGTNSSSTLYTRFTMTFFDINGETGTGGCYGGLEYYLGNTEQLLVGNNWPSTNWSIGAAAPNEDLLPVTPIVLNEYHTMVIKTVYSPGTNANVQVWLDPDFTRSESSQPNPPVVLTMNNTFDNIHLRCGNGTAMAEFSNITMAATATDVGFAPESLRSVLSLHQVSGQLQLSWTGTGTLEVAPAPQGPWIDATTQLNPQTLYTTNSAQFFRLRQ